MSTLFDDHVTRAIQASPPEKHIIMAVEKEILHHDILRTLHEAGLLKRLTFFGGTSLRLCHGSSRLSEDLDFKGGKDFHPGDFTAMSSVIVEGLSRKYELDVTVEDPKIKSGNTDTWTIRVITRAESRSEKQQRINIDVCRLTCFERAPMLLANYYGVDLGTSGLIINTQSKRESFTDKIIALAFRHRLQPRDLWDLAWLKQTTSDTSPFHLLEKIAEHGRTTEDFLCCFELTVKKVQEDKETRDTYIKEISRFLPSRQIATALDPGFWTYTGRLVGEELLRCEAACRNVGEGPRWTM
jgi:predicted nucleotidyltransferase component of viral defense system